MAAPPAQATTDTETDSSADPTKDPAADYDSPWKEALEQYFPAFVELLVPQLYKCINWSVDPVFLNKELQAVARKSATGKRYVDKLVRVLSTDDQPLWLLIHIEVQSNRMGVKGLHLFTERMFTERMFNYYCGLRLHHAKIFQDHPVRRHTHDQ